MPINIIYKIIKIYKDSYMKVKIENLLISILIPLLLGLIASLLTKNNMQIYN